MEPYQKYCRYLKYLVINQRETKWLHKNLDTASDNTHQLMIHISQPRLTHIITQAHSPWWAGTVLITRVSCPVRLPALYTTRGSVKLRLNERKRKKVWFKDLRCRDVQHVSAINLSDISQFTFDPHPPPTPLPTCVAQDMTQSWPSQQALGGDQAQQILYNSKVCLCVV